ncbi:MAG: MFS transporter [Rhodospirillales bacterium]|nr:MFS transporter [Rhodospirillales bacterium]
MLPDAAIARLSAVLAERRRGCILALPHVGSLELFAAYLHDRGFDLGFVYTIGRSPTPTEQWIRAGRNAILGTGIPFGRRDTRAAIAEILRRNGVVIVVVDVYPSDRYRGIGVAIHDAVFTYPPGPARFARAGTPVLGVLSDRFGRRPVLLLSLAGSVIDYLIMGFSPHLWLLFLGRAIAGVTAAHGAVATAFLTDVTPEDRRARRFGWGSAEIGLNGLVAIIGPLLFSGLYAVSRGRWNGAVWLAGLAILAVAAPVVLGLRARPG